ncbi:50S ribosomal protein L37ae [Candidatus Woesearchaeota archaeon]|nr:50S ribosomal protein L37ae [Candidatus Woesearchaeota archaeon]
MGKTKKVGTAGRYGVRYGLKLRNKLLEVERKQKIKHECPKCHKLQLKRLAVGIWACRKCNHQFAGRAYWPIGE